MRISYRTRGFRIAWLFTVATGASLAATPAHASEGGGSFYLLGSGGAGAGEMPPVEGVFFDNTLYYYTGEASAEREFVVGGNVVVGLEAEIIADFASLLWVPSTDVAGGTFAVGAAMAVGSPSINVDAVLTGPAGNQGTASREDSAWVVGDPVLTTALGWKLGDKVHLQTSATVNVPIGQYLEDDLANLSFHRWIVDTSVAVTYKDEESGWDLSSKVGLTFNGTNEYTDYNTGNEFHLEASLEKSLTRSFSAGVQFYHYNQITGDSGEGAVLGPNKGKVSALGVTAAYNFTLDKTPITARVRVFDEFDVTRRLDGTAAFFSLTMPLSMKLPGGSGG